MFSFFFFFFVEERIELRSLKQKRPRLGNMVLIPVLSICRLTAKAMAKYEKLRKLKCEVNPKTEANLFSRLTFWWMSGILAIGNARPLENEDLFPLLDELKSQGQTKRLEQAWHDEIQQDPRCARRKGFRLFKSLLKMFSWSDYAFQLSVSAITFISNVLQPVFLSLLLPLLMFGSNQDSRWAYIYGAGICVSSLICSLGTCHALNNGYLLSVRWKVATVGLIFKKVGTRQYITQFSIVKYCVSRGTIWLFTFLFPKQFANQYTNKNRTHT